MGCYSEASLTCLGKLDHGVSAHPSAEHNMQGVRKWASNRGEIRCELTARRDLCKGISHRQRWPVAGVPKEGARGRGQSVVLSEVDRA